MRYWLHVHDAPRAAGARRLVRDDIGDTDEVLCGACQALLTVDHTVWVNAGGPDLPGEGNGLVTCELCGTVNDAQWVTRWEVPET